MQLQAIVHLFTQMDAYFQHQVYLSQSLVLFTVSVLSIPRGDTRNITFWLRGYLKRGDTQNAVTLSDSMKRGLFFS